MEEAFSKLKALLRRGAQARTKETLLEEIGRALEAITPEDDVRGWFSHCGYAVAQSL